MIASYKLFIFHEKYLGWLSSKISVRVVQDKRYLPDLRDERYLRESCRVLQDNCLSSSVEPLLQIPSVEFALEKNLTTLLANEAFILSY